MAEPSGERTAEELVGDFTDSEKRFPAYLALDALGTDALPALKEGLKHDDWQIRRWSAILMDRHADDEALHALVPLLRDPKSKVRLWAVHSISCDACKVDENPIDVVPLLIERIEVDVSIRVRRMATAMLAHHCTVDARALPVFEKILASEDDRKLRLHAEVGRKRYAEDSARD